MVDPFRLPRVKVCGMTSARDVALAVEAGADAVGFVHYEPSPRSVAPERIPELRANAPNGVLTVLVLVSADPELALRWAQAADINALQLCGEERAQDWRDFPLPILRRIAVAPDAERELAAWSGVARGFVADHPGAPGGTGMGVDLELARRIHSSAPCLAAGGLDPEKVARIVRELRPRGVDASSRLECEPGVKDPELVHAFCANARAAFEEIPL